MTGGKVQDLIADGNADTSLSADAEHSEREVRQRKIGMTVRRLDEGLHSQPSSFKSAIGSSNEHEPKEIANSSRSLISSSLETRRSCHQRPPSSNAKARGFSSRRICVANLGRAAAMKTFRKPCMAATGPPAAYVNGFTQRTGW